MLPHLPAVDLPERFADVYERVFSGDWTAGQGGNCFFVEAADILHTGYVDPGSYLWIDGHPHGRSYGGCFGLSSLRSFMLQGNQEN